MSKFDLQSFVSDILCMDVADDFIESLLVTLEDFRKVFKMDRLLETSYMRGQVALSIVWDRVFGLPPTPMDIQTFYKASPKTHKDAVHHVLQNSYIQWFKEKDSIERDLIALLESSCTDDYLNTARKQVLARWAASGQFPLASKASMSLTEIHAGRVPYTAVPDETRLTNPLTSICISSCSDSSDCAMSRQEWFRYVLTRDTYFQMVRMHGNTLVVVVDDGTCPYGDLLAMVNMTLEAIPSSSMRPVVLWSCVIVRDKAEIQQHVKTIEMDLGSWGVCCMDSLEFAKNIPRRFLRSILIAPGHAEPPCGPWSPLGPSGPNIFVTDVESPAKERIRDMGYGVVFQHSSGTPCDTFVDNMMSEPAMYQVPRLPSHDDKIGSWRADLLVQCMSRVMRDKEDSIYAGFVLRSVATLWSRGLFQQSSSLPLKKKTILAIDNRKNPFTVYAILHTLACLGSSWDVTMMCTPDAAEYYRSALPPHLTTIVEETPILNRKAFGIEDYNVLLRSTWIWELLSTAGYETALLVQDDGLLVRKGLDELDLEDRWDYVGAPWVDVAENASIKAKTHSRLTGNGGLSLRNVQTMLSISKSRPCSLFLAGYLTEPEDVFFAAGVAESSVERLPPIEASMLFSSEEILCKKSVGFHKPWPYHPRQVVAQFFQDCLRDAP